MTQTIQTDWGGKKLLGMMLITGLAISSVSLFMVDYEFTNSPESVVELTMLCDNGFCSNVLTESVTEDSFVQYSTDLNSDEIIQKTESFSSFTLNKNKVEL